MDGNKNGGGGARERERGMGKGGFCGGQRPAVMCRPLRRPARPIFVDIFGRARGLRGGPAVRVRIAFPVPKRDRRRARNSRAVARACRRETSRAGVAPEFCGDAHVPLAGLARSARQQGTGGAGGAGGAEAIQSGSGDTHQEAVLLLRRLNAARAGSGGGTRDLSSPVQCSAVRI